MAKKKKPLGRPSLGGKPTVIRLPDDHRERIRDLVGDRGMAKYIRDAVDEKLARDSKQKG
jgi:hypothetical protein